jgi:signal peptidase I
MSDTSTQASDESARKLRQDGKQSRKWIIENVVSLGLALLLVFMIRSSVVEAFKIPSGSMIPTLLIGDHIFVNKFAYGVKVPFSDVVTGEPIHIVKRDPPKRGDIIVFIFPRDESLYYIKRVVGVPGDTVEVRNKALFINGQPVERAALPPTAEETVFDQLEDPKYSRTTLEVFTEKLGGHEHVIMQDRNNFLGETYAPVQVPPDHLFVMGDNRDFSNDSRFWGFVPMKNVKGKAMVIWLSLWVNFENNQLTFRPDRIGTVLR